MPQDDISRVHHILDAASDAVCFCEGFDYNAFSRDARTFRAVIQCAKVIGEAASHLSAEAREAMPEIPWEKGQGMRNHLARVYYDVDLEMLWFVVRNDLPALIDASERYLN